MKKRIFSIFLGIFLVVNMLSLSVFAQENPKNIIIVMNRTSVNDLYTIPYLKEELSTRGYIGLMNVRSSHGTSDVRSYASLGDGTRSYLNASDVDFEPLNQESESTYYRRTNLEPWDINNLNINELLMTNLDGEYGATPGALGKELTENGRSIAVLGNADTNEDLHREACLIGMDDNGRVNGNLDLSIPDETMPFGIKTDYEKLLSETKKYYENNDVLVVELGDTYRLDLEKPNLNNAAYESMKQSIYQNIGQYLKSVFEFVGPNDKIKIVSPYPEIDQYKEGYRLSPIVLFEGDGKGVVYSNSTRRDGIIANIDLAPDILNDYGIDSELMGGKEIQTKVKENNIQFLHSENERTVSTANIRIPVLYTYAVCLMTVWIMAFGFIIARQYTGIHKMTFNILSEILKFAMAVPIALLVAPILKFSNEVSIISGVIMLSIIIYVLISVIVKDELYKLIDLSLIMAIGILLDAMTGQNMIKNSIFGYDPIIGARYYGVGNEYMGVLIGASILSLTGLLQKNKISRTSVVVLLAFTAIILGFPKMGANVGGNITAVFCFLFLIFKLYDMKIDIKKIIYICIAVVFAVAIMAYIDIYVMGTKSHLAGAIGEIASDGPGVIITIIKRKIAMNLKLIGVSIWSKVLILGLVIVGVLFSRPFGILKRLCEMYPILSKGWSAIIVGSIIGFLVNDSGVVAAATSIAYVIIPVLVLTIKNIDKLSQD